MPLRAFLFSLTPPETGISSSHWSSRNALAGVFVFSPMCRRPAASPPLVRRNALAGVFVFSRNGLPVLPESPSAEGRNALAGVFVFSLQGKGKMMSLAAIRSQCPCGRFCFLSNRDVNQPAPQDLRVAMPLRAFLFSLVAMSTVGSWTV